MASGLQSLSCSLELLSLLNESLYFFGGHSLFLSHTSSHVGSYILVDAVAHLLCGSSNVLTSVVKAIVYTHEVFRQSHAL